MFCFQLQTRNCRHPAKSTPVVFSDSVRTLVHFGVREAMSFSDGVHFLVKVKPNGRLAGTRDMFDIQEGRRFKPVPSDRTCGSCEQRLGRALRRVLSSQVMTC
mmetsp:Transcript_14364/g.39168  ORF Transcript_14364/g.39168 Transcript_14364/m.39168 type:complete len:103 (+) Transcript_14364:3549-3857(+)